MTIGEAELAVACCGGGFLLGRFLQVIERDTSPPREEPPIVCRRCNMPGHDKNLEGPAGHNCRVAIGQVPGPFKPWDRESGRPRPGPEDETPPDGAA